MDAVLKKHSDGRFSLSHKESGWWIGDSDHDKVKAHKGEQILSKLSLKNCEAIVNGYDLDELVLELEEHHPNGIYDFKTREKIGFKLGFKKALEILGDKKFSEVNMLKSFITGVFTDETSDHDFEFTELMKDLQQTEWDVEILEVENDEVYSVSENMKVAHNKAFDGVLFKHDADSCLILKRKI